MVIDDNVLFNPINDQYFFAGRFEEAIDQKITVQGYYGDQEIAGYKVFYITDVTGWHSVCCDATSSEVGGNISSPNVCHWFKK